MKSPLLSLSAVFAILIVTILSLRPDRHPTADRNPAPNPVASPAPARPTAPSAQPEAPEEQRPVTLLPISQTADDLHHADLSANDDFLLLEAILQQYQRHHGGNPVGDNDDILAALRGRNPERLGYFPVDHQAIDAHGQLLDRWGAPYFFHQLSAKEMEIRSAGPDRALWTDDDLVHNRK